MPPGVTLPKGLVLPAGLVLPPGINLPATIPPDYEFPAGVLMPPGFVFPPGVVIPRKSAASATDSHTSTSTAAMVAAGLSTVIIGAVAALVLRSRRHSTAVSAQPVYEVIA
jgi:hypothetical protein